MERGPKEKVGGVKLDVCDIGVGNMTAHGMGKGKGGQGLGGKVGSKSW